MSCEKWQPLLVRAADEGPDALEPQDATRLTAHLNRCDDCRELLAGQRIVRQALAARPAAPAPPGLAARVRAELDGAPHWTELLAWRTWTYRLAPVAVGLLTVALVIGNIGSTGSTESTGSGGGGESDGSAGSGGSGRSVVGGERGTAGSSPPAGVAEVAAAWVAGEPDAGGMPAFALLGQDGVDGDRLLEVLLRSAPDEPLER